MPGGSIPQHPLERPGHRPELDQVLGEPEHLRGYWAAFLRVAIQQAFRSPASGDLWGARIVPLAVTWAFRRPVRIR